MLYTTLDLSFVFQFYLERALKETQCINLQIFIYNVLSTLFVLQLDEEAKC